MREKTDKVAVVVLNYNSAADCRKCVSFLKRQENVALDIVLVDNCSKDDDKEEVEQLAKAEECSFIASTENRGYNAGNNIGLRYAASKGYKYAMVANPDMEFPDPHYVSALIAKMDEDPQIAVLGSDIVGADGQHQNPMNVDGNWKNSFDWIKNIVKKDNWGFIDDFTTSHYCHKVSGSCLLVRLQTLQEIGFFDDNVFLYCEEAILAKQIQRSGKKLFYTADVQAIHAHFNSQKGNPVPRFRHWLHSRLYYIDKYSGDPFFGKFVSKLSMRIYVFSLILAMRVKNG